MKAVLLFVLIFSSCHSTKSNLHNLLEKTVKPHVLQPILQHRPFVSVWNVITEPCTTKHNITIDLSFFDIITNSHQARFGDNMMIFYVGMIGLYPHFDRNDSAVNGGIPQLGNLTAHLEKAKSDIEKYLPDENYQGLAVIDWESWRPLWTFNDFGESLKYCDASIMKVKKEHPTWKKEKVVVQAKIEFETAAKAYMLKTLRLGVLLRPKAKWGYYLFPDCFNYDKTGSNLTCRSSILKANDKIEWMFGASTALYPSTYLGIWFKNKTYAADYTANRVNEAKRVDRNRPGNISIPVFVYNNLIYRLKTEFLIYKDVVDSSGVAAVLGASGVVIWGPSLAGSSQSCMRLKKYVEATLGPYLKLASDSASQCSIDMCNGNGRCVLIQPTFPKLPQTLPHLFTLFLKKTLSSNQEYDVICQCYLGYAGKSCQYY